MTDEREFVYHPVTVSMVTRQGEDTLTENISAPVCDFCFDSRLRWEYDCETFTIPEINFGSENGWLSCDRCSDLIEEQNWEALSDRSIRSWINRMGDLDAWHARMITTIQKGFSEHYTPGRKAFG
jgi:hypothetical protein